MDLNRRFVLKMVALTPLTLRTTLFQDVMELAMPKISSRHLDIFLHGFFLIEVQGKNLVIASPKYEDHVFGYWDHTDRKLHTPPPVNSTAPFPWIAALDTKGNADKFPKSLLHFGRGAVGSGTGPFIPPPDDKHLYKWYLRLPLPAQIRGVRQGGNISEMAMSSNSKIAKSVYDHCGYNKKLKLITRLRYNTVTPVNISSINLYAEHCSPPNFGDLNKLFCETAKLMPAFDFGFSDKPKDGAHLPCPHRFDEKALCELNSYLADNPCKKDCPCPPGLDMIRTANCPQFGITGS
ncbi:MAG TPA: hypothetical protein VF532_08370 [Candidatus Angelobacter sp.]